MTERKASNEFRMSSQSPAAARPLIHIPIYCGSDATVYTVEYMVELMCACLDSYFAHGNDYDVLVTTNDPRPLEMLSTYRSQSGRRFELRLVTHDELLAVFRTDARKLSNDDCLKMLFSKFYPFLKGLHPRLVHVDFDTIFMTKVDLEPLFVADIGLARPFCARRGALDSFGNPEGAWYPHPSQVAFFRMNPETLRPRERWINSGIFAAQAGGMELLRAEVEHYLANLDRAVEIGINTLADEILMNALAVREPGAVALVDHDYNSLAYNLIQDPSWMDTCKILHFHALKPNLLRCASSAVPPWPSPWRGEEVRISESLYLAENPTEHLPRVASNEDFHLAAVTWFLHLHAACRSLPYAFPMLRAVPFEVATREHERLTAKLRSRLAS